MRERRDNRAVPDPVLSDDIYMRGERHLPMAGQRQ